MFDGDGVYPSNLIVEASSQKRRLRSANHLFESVRRPAAHLIHLFYHQFIFASFFSIIMTTRYVPLGDVSLSSDAPGYEAPCAHKDDTKELGPLCWKCRGAGTCKLKKAEKKRKRPNTTAKAEEKPSQELRPCPVCSGSGHLPPKVASSKEGSKALPGMITASRRRAVMSGATAQAVMDGPDAFVVGRMKTILASENKSEGAISEGELKSLKLLQSASQITNSDPGTKLAGIEVPPPPSPSAGADEYIC